jgi:exocyst complex component 1
MQQQLKSIEEARVPRRSKCAILPFIANFEKFVETTESIFKNSERRFGI